MEQLNQDIKIAMRQFRQHLDSTQLAILVIIHLPLLTASIKWYNRKKQILCAMGVFHVLISFVLNAIPADHLIQSKNVFSMNLAQWQKLFYQSIMVTLYGKLQTFETENYEKSQLKGLLLVLIFSLISLENQDCYYIPLIIFCAISCKLIKDQHQRKIDALQRNRKRYMHIVYSVFLLTYGIVYYTQTTHLNIYVKLLAQFIYGLLMYIDIPVDKRMRKHDK